MYERDLVNSRESPVLLPVLDGGRFRRSSTGRGDRRRVSLEPINRSDAQKKLTDEDSYRMIDLRERKVWLPGLLCWNKEKRAMSQLRPSAGVKEGGGGGEFVGRTGLG